MLNQISRYIAPIVYRRSITDPFEGPMYMLMEEKYGRAVVYQVTGCCPLFSLFRADAIKKLLTLEF